MPSTTDSPATDYRVTDYRLIDDADSGHAVTGSPVTGHAVTNHAVVCRLVTEPARPHVPSWLASPPVPWASCASRRSAWLLGCLGFAVTVIMLSAISAAHSPVESLQGFTMGTNYSIRVADPVDNVERLQAEIDECLELVNDQMSTWREDSELSRFNRSRETDWFPVSPETAEVVAEAQRISRLTDGAFDVTVGPLVNLWQFGPERPEGPPDPEQIETTLQHVGYQGLDVRLDPPALRKQHPDCYVDLSGIAKGFGVDQVARLLEQRGLTNFLVEIGGEVVTRGEKEPGVAWRIGIESPQVDSRRLQRALELTDLALATSGDYRNVRHIDGKWVSHTIDPRTGYPVEHGLGSVTVVTQTCMEADALATALMVLGPSSAYDWVVAHNVAALLISREGDRGELVERASPRFAELFPELSANPSGSSATDRQGNSAKMFSLFLITLLVFVVAIAAMAVGVMFGRRRMQGSCGGLANFKDSEGRSVCEACHDPSPSCSGVEEGRRRAAEGTQEEESIR